MEDKDNLLYDLVKLIGEKCIQQVKDKNGVGNRDFEIESVKRLPDDPHWVFEVTTWSDQSEEPRKVEKVDYIQLTEMIARALSFSVRYDAGSVILKV